MPGRCGSVRTPESGGPSTASAASTQEQTAQKEAARNEVKNTTKAQLNKMSKSKLAEFIRKAIVAVATSPAEVLAKTLEFESKLMTATKDSLLKTANQLKGMV